MMQNVTVSSLGTEADLEGGVGGQIRGPGGRKSPNGVQGRSSGRGSRGRSPPRSWSIFKVHSLKFKARPCENEMHNLMSLMSFYCSAHQHCVVSESCCTMFGILGAMLP